MTEDLKQCIRNEPEPVDPDPATDWAALRRENARRVSEAQRAGRCRVGRPVDLQPRDCRGPVIRREPLRQRLRLAVRAPTVSSSTAWR